MERELDMLIDGQILNIIETLDRPNQELIDSLEKLADACDLKEIKTRKTDLFDSQKHVNFAFENGPRDRVIKVIRRGFRHGDRILNKADVTVGDSKL